jgi:hypothetical protein
MWRRWAAMLILGHNKTTQTYNPIAQLNSRNKRQSIGESRQQRSGYQPLFSQEAVVDIKIVVEME